MLLSRSHAVIPEEFHDVLKPYLEVFDGRLARPVEAGVGAGEGGVARAVFGAAGGWSTCGREVGGVPGRAVWCR